MWQNIIEVFFALLRSAICTNQLDKQQIALCNDKTIPILLEIAKKHDVVHLINFALKENGIENIDNKYMINAVYRYEQLNYEYERLCDALETAQIPFIPLKGSVLRQYYPETWMRTSCDIDVLIQKADLQNATSYLVNNLGYMEKGQATHDVAFITQGGQRFELHFDLLEEGRANNAIEILQTVWDNVTLHKDYSYWYEMTDEFFYYYHIAHMAKHFENGGCGIRPFIDLYLLDNIDCIDQQSRDSLLEKGGLLKFANTARYLSGCWMDDNLHNEISLKMQNYIISGGVYGTSQNRVAIQQQRKGGRIGYLTSRVFIPFSKLKRYYPVLEKYPWLAPIMQVRRWFMLLNPNIAKMAKSELQVNKDIDKTKTDDMNTFLFEIGL